MFTPVPPISKAARLTGDEHGGFWFHGLILTQRRGDAEKIPAHVLLAAVMRQSARKRKKLDYPEETEGSRLAAKVRKLASKLTPEEEAEHFRRGILSCVAR